MRWRAWVLSAALLGLACSDGFFFEPPAGTADLAVAFDAAGANVSAATLASAFDKADQARIAMSRSSGTPVLDTIVPFDPRSPAVELALSFTVPEEGEVFGLVGALLSGNAVVFQGETTVALAPDRSTTAEIAIEPMVTGIVAPPSISFDALLDTLPVPVYGLFSTGDSIPDIPVLWTDLDASVVMAGPNGTLVSIGEGSSLAVATSGQFADTVNVVVDAVVDSVDVQPDVVNADVEQQIQYTATALDRNGNALERSASWSVADESIAFIDSGGLLTTSEEGTTTVSADVEGVTGSGTLIVTRIIPVVATVTVQPGPAEVWLGGTTQLQAIARDNQGAQLTGRTVEWSSSDESVAPVSGTGLVSGQALGDATITATVEGVSGSASVSVIPVPVQQVTVSPASSVLLVGGQVQLTAAVEDANGNIVTDRTLTWQSSASSVASVGVDGLVSGVAGGTATITATADGVSGSATVTVPTPTAVAGGTYNYFDGESFFEGTAILYDPTNDLDPGSPISSLDIDGPAGWFNGTAVCDPIFFEDDGLAPDRAVCLKFIAAVSGSYVGTTELGSTQFSVDASSTLPVPVIEQVLTSGLSQVAVDWSGDPSHASFGVQILDINANFESIAAAVVPGSDEGVVFEFDVPLDPDGEYYAVVTGFSVDLTVQGAQFPATFEAAESEEYFFPSAPSSFWVTGYSNGSVTILDQPENTVSGGDSGFGAVGLADIEYAASELSVFVADAGDPTGVVYVFQTFDGQAVNSIDAGGSIERLALSPDGTALYAASSDGIVYAIDTRFEQVSDSIGLGVPHGGIAVDLDGSKLYVTKTDGTVSVISTSTYSVLTTLSVGSDPRGVAVHGDRAYVANSGDNTVSVIDAAQDAVLGTVNVGSGPEDVAISPDGSFAYVVNRSAGTVSVIETLTDNVVGTITVGSLPQSVAFAPADELAYVTNFGDGTVSVISTITDEVVDTISLSGAGPWGVVVQPPPGPNFQRTTPYETPLRQAPTRRRIGSLEHDAGMLRQTEHP